ncbi:hypothetical protein [Geobacillus sp. WSUCF-018B]|uniref:hypothetical protein n=1 Tax=Geobacillus sp. WSUCF-018B TaxID=2055939 RepID=UPI0013047830|nr:hypothetical protein [Geobacillus sp. WSUCF-018B]
MRTPASQQAVNQAIPAHFKWGGFSHSHQVKNLIFFQRQKHGILSNENHRWKGLFFDGKKDEGMDNNDSSTLLL